MDGRLDEYMDAFSRLYGGDYPMIERTHRCVVPADKSEEIRTFHHVDLVHQKLSIFATDLSSLKVLKSFATLPHETAKRKIESESFVVIG
ncbi:hypothetical protein ACLOJK_013989 [Asimina triloba]